MKKWLKRIGLGVVGLALIAVAVYGYVRKANEKDVPAVVKATVLLDQDIRAAIKGDKGESGIACWDMNGNGIQDADEDANGDKLFNALDCQGPQGIQGKSGKPGEKGDKGEAGKDGADGVCNASTCKGAVAKIPLVSTVTGAPVPKVVKKVQPVAKKAEPAAKSVPKAVEPAETPRIQVYQPVSVTINGQADKGKERDARPKEQRTSPLGSMTVTNNGTMVLAPVNVVVE